MAVPEIKIKVGADTTALDAGLTKAQESVKTFAKTAEATSGTLGGGFEKAGDKIREGIGKGAADAARSIASMLNPANLVTTGLLALGAAALAYFSNTENATKTVDEALKRHGELIKAIKDSYGEASAGLEKYTRDSNAALEAQLRGNMVTLQQQLVALSSETANAVSRVLPALDELSARYGDITQSGFSAAKGMEPFATAIETLRAGIASGTPDLKSFREAVAEVMNAAKDNQSIQEMGNRLLEMTQKAYGVEAALGQASRAMRQLSSDAQQSAGALTQFNKLLEEMGKISPAKVDEKKRLMEIRDAALAVADGYREAAIVRKAYDEGVKRIDAAAAEKNKAAKPVDNTNWELEAEKALLESKMELLRRSLLSKDELMQENFVKNQEMIKRAGELEVGTEQGRLQILEQMNADHYARLEAMREAANMKAIQSMGDMFGSLQQISESWGKKNSALSKAFGIAQALISTYVGAAKALELPFPANLAAFAAVMAKGLAAVAAITSVNTSGKGGNAPRAVGGGSGAGGGAAQQAAPDQAGRSMYVTVQGDIFNREMVRNLLEKVQQFQKDGGGKVVFG